MSKSPTKKDQKSPEGNPYGVAYTSSARFLSSSPKSPDRESNPSSKKGRKVVQSPTHFDASGDYDSLPSANSVSSVVPSAIPEEGQGRARSASMK